MNRLVSTALAGMLAVGAVAASAAAANADPYNHPHPHYYPHYQGYHGYHGYHDDGGYVAAGVLGLTAGLFASQVLAPEPPPPEPYPYYASGYGPDASEYATDDAHIQWCESRYRSYDPETDLWRDYQDVPHQCVGPG
jgi:hypothetical protein